MQTQKKSQSVSINLSCTFWIWLFEKSETFSLWDPGCWAKILILQPKGMEPLLEYMHLLKSVRILNIIIPMKETRSPNIEAVYSKSNPLTRSGIYT